MSVQIRRRREAAAFLQTYVGAQGELLVDTTNNRVQVHDGATPGGWPAARLADVAQRTAVADASYQALASDRTIAFTALTAARTVTLPAAAAYPTGTQLLVVDEAGAATSSTTITLARGGGDTINGATGVTIASAFGYVAVESNGVSRWTVVDQAVAAAGGGGSGAAGATGATGPQGNAGATGSTGPQGTQGNAGAAGPQGSTGATGATGPQGTQGNAGAAGPQGSTGATGAQGAQGTAGATGAQGNAGATGSTGAQGAQGTAGATGPQGNAGATGATGAQGTQGTAGATGPQGSAGGTGPTGPQGTQGNAGATGPQGNAGATGATGAQGTQGGAGATGATGAAGSSVTIKGSVSTSSALPSSGNALGDGYIANDTGDLWVYSNSSASGSVNGFVNVGLVRGPAGPQGATGPTGPQGTQGTAGAAGVTGPTGPQGTQGTIGTTGATGPQGTQGTAGTAGATGPQGTQGTAGTVGATGPTGPQGTQGAAGTSGVTGPTGAQGTQGTAGTVGATGPTGAQGTQGTAGTAGATGPTGAQGTQGAAGTAGVTGPTGAQGTQGTAGTVGATGPTGAQGTQGTAGTAGATGPTGAQGTQGTAGTVGATGPTGAQGPQGNAGTTGATGAAGFARTQVSDAAYTALASDRTVAYTALTAARTITLPAASAYPAGAMLTVLDESGACSATLTLTLAAAGSDMINGAATAVVATAFGYLALESNTSNKWTIIDAPAPVLSVAGRVGAITLGVADVAGAAPLASPVLTGTPTAPNAPAGTNSSQLATTSFVAASFVTYAYAGQTYATASNATLTGTPTAPTQAPKDNSTKLATTGYTDAAVAAVTARRQVSDAATSILATDRTVAYTALTAARTVSLPAASAYPAGAVLTLVDESGACSATLTLTLAAAGSDTINGAATAVVATAFGYLALESNTSNKWTIIDAPAPVLSVAGRAGAVTLGVADVAGAAPLASPALTGTPTGPNAAAGTNSSQLATTSFVAASFVTYAYAGQTYATASNATLTGTPTAPTQAPKDNSTKLATTGYTDAAIGAGFARTQVNDAAYNVAATDRTVAYIALTAARTVTLPASSAYPLGATLTIVDESGACSPTNTITLAAAGSDLINGVGAAFLALAYGILAVESNGAGKWTLVEPLGTLAVQNSGTTNTSSTGSGAFFAHTPTVTLPAGFLGSGRALRVIACFRMTTGSSTPPVFSIRLRAGSTPIGLLAQTGAPSNSQNAVAFGFTFIVQALAAPSASSNVETTTLGNSNPTQPATMNTISQPVALATSAALILAIDTQWATAGSGTNTLTLSQLIVEALN